MREIIVRSTEDENDEKSSKYLLLRGPQKWTNLTEINQQIQIALKTDMKIEQKDRENSGAHQALGLA